MTAAPPLPERFESVAALLDGGYLANDGVGEPALALDAADARGRAALTNF